MAENASAKNATKAMPMLAAEVSTNVTTAEEYIIAMLSSAFLKAFVQGTPDDAADINRYAIICNQNQKLFNNIYLNIHKIK
jgi:hypothetical protein